MCFLVAFKSSQLPEGLATLVARVGLHPRVGTQVNVEVPFVIEVFVTDFALVRLLVGVDPLVTAQGGVMGEPLETESAAVWLLPGVDPLVSAEV